MALAVTDTLNDIAQEASVIFEGRCSLPSFSARYPSFALDEAYRVKYRDSPYLAPMIGERARSATVKITARDDA